MKWFPKSVIGKNRKSLAHYKICPFSVHDESVKFYNKGSLFQFSKTFFFITEAAEE
jgi:hypothetical protein